MILLDTNILIEYLKGNKSFIEPYGLDELFISDIVVMELYQGARNKSDLNFIVKNIADFKILKSHDEIIASTAMVYDMKLMSLNRKDFIYLDGVELV